MLNPAPKYITSYILLSSGIIGYYILKVLTPGSILAILFKNNPQASFNNITLLIFNIKKRCKNLIALIITHYNSKKILIVIYYFINNIKKSNKIILFNNFNAFIWCKY